MNKNDLIVDLVNLRKMMLKNNPTIKKYNKARKLHGEILRSMSEYFGNPLVYESKTEEMDESIYQCGINRDIALKANDESDNTILTEIFTYKVFPTLKSITEEYIEKHKFRNAEKIKMLHAMNNSIVGLFKIIDIDYDTCYVTYEDVFTHKKYKLIDVSCATLYKSVYKERDLYIYNRLITYENITFGTGMQIEINTGNKKFKDFIKKHNYKKYSDLYRCLYLYYLEKDEEYYEF